MEKMRFCGICGTETIDGVCPKCSQIVQPQSVDAQDVQPQQDYPQQPVQPQGYPQQGAGYSQQPAQPQGYPQQNVGYQQQSVQSQGYPQQGAGYSQQPVQPQGYPQQGAGYQQQAQPQGYPQQNVGYPQQPVQPQGYPQQFMPGQPPIAARPAVPKMVRPIDKVALANITLKLVGVVAAIFTLIGCIGLLAGSSKIVELTNSNSSDNMELIQAAMPILVNHDFARFGAVVLFVVSILLAALQRAINGSGAEKTASKVTSAFGGIGFFCIFTSSLTLILGIMVGMMLNIKNYKYSSYKEYREFAASQGQIAANLLRVFLIISMILIMISAVAMIASFIYSVYKFFTSTPRAVSYPQQGFPQQSYPQQGYPQQGYPQQGYSQQVAPVQNNQNNNNQFTGV